MRLSEFFKRTGNNIAIFCQKVFGDNPDQYVESTDDGSLVAAAVMAGLPKQEAAVAIQNFRDLDSRGRDFDNSVTSSIQLEHNEKSPYDSSSIDERVEARTPYQNTTVTPRAKQGKDREERVR